MSDLRLNSIFGAVLASVLGIMVVGVGADAIVHANYPEKAGFLPVAQQHPPARRISAVSSPIRRNWKN
jgi:hypothetical protein